MKDDAKKLKNTLDSMVTPGTNCIVSNPETIQALKDKGVPIEETFITYEEYLEKLVNDKKKDAIARLRKLPQIDPSVADGVISEIYEEIRSSYALGFFTSTIVNSIFLLEYAMRIAVFKFRLKTDPKAIWEHTENMAMKKLISQINKINLINEDELIVLNEFNDKLRDPYLHINIYELTKGVMISKLPGFNIHTGEKTELLNVNASEHRFLWFAAKRVFDKFQVEPVLNFCIYWTNKLLVEKKLDK